MQWTYLARSQNILKHASLFVWSINWCTRSQFSTTLTLLQKSLLDMEMTHIHHSMDIQLFEVTKQTCWYPVRFCNVIAHPGGMHILQSFISCIVKLMKSSGLEVLRGCSIWGPDRYANVAYLSELQRRKNRGKKGWGLRRRRENEKIENHAVHTQKIEARWSWRET